MSAFPFILKDMYNNTLEKISEYLIKMSTLTEWQHKISISLFLSFNMQQWQLKFIHEAVSWMAGTDKEHSRIETHKFTKHTHGIGQSDRYQYTSQERYKQVLQTAEHIWKEMRINENLSLFMWLCGCFHLHICTLCPCSSLFNACVGF